MGQERMKILNMLEEGKITAEDAVRLLEFVNVPEGDGKAEDAEKVDWHLEEKFNAFAQNVNGLAKEFGTKVEAAYKDLEPKLKKASHKVVEKTAAVIDEISKALNESLRNMEAKQDDCGCECECDCGCEDDGPREN